MKSDLKWSPSLVWKHFNWPIFCGEKHVKTKTLASLKLAIDVMPVSGKESGIFCFVQPNMPNFVLNPLCRIRLQFPTIMCPQSWGLSAQGLRIAGAKKVCEAKPDTHCRTLCCIYYCCGNELIISHDIWRCNQIIPSIDVDKYIYIYNMLIVNLQFNLKLIFVVLCCSQEECLRWRIWILCCRSGNRCPATGENRGRDLEV